MSTEELDKALKALEQIKKLDQEVLALEKFVVCVMNGTKVKFTLHTLEEVEQGDHITHHDIFDAMNALRNDFMNRTFRSIQVHPAPIEHITDEGLVYEIAALIMRNKKKERKQLINSLKLKL